jgi:hypothetical protein
LLGDVRETYGENMVRTISAEMERSGISPHQCMDLEKILSVEGLLEKLEQSSREVELSKRYLSQREETVESSYKEFSLPWKSARASCG